jgi:hypothetical protein
MIPSVSDLSQSRLIWAANTPSRRGTAHTMLLEWEMEEKKVPDQ